MSTRGYHQLGNVCRSQRLEMGSPVHFPASGSVQPPTYHTGQVSVPVHSLCHIFPYWVVFFLPKEFFVDSGFVICLIREANISPSILLVFNFAVRLFKIGTSGGAWVAQSVKWPTSAQVMISRSVSSSPASGSGLMAQSPEPASDSVSPSLSAPPPFMLCLCLKKNK